MIEIECPKCHTVFEEDESKFASIVQQVRDREFHKELEAQVATVKAAHKSELDAALAKAAGDAREESSRKDEEIASLKAQMEALKKQQKRSEKEQRTLRKYMARYQKQKERRAARAARKVKPQQTAIPDSE